MTPVHHDDGEVLAVVDELVHEGHAAGPSAHHQVVAGEGGHLLQVLQFVKNLRSFFGGGKFAYNYKSVILSYAVFIAKLCFTACVR